MRDYFLRDGEEQNYSKSRHNIDQNTFYDPPLLLSFRNARPQAIKKRVMRICSMNKF